MGHHNAALGQDQLDVTQAQAEDVIQPHGVADDLGRKPVPGIGRGFECHAVSLSRPSSQRQPRLTWQCRRSPEQPDRARPPRSEATDRCDVGFQGFPTRRHHDRPYRADASHSQRTVPTGPAGCARSNCACGLKRRDRSLKSPRKYGMHLLLRPICTRAVQRSLLRPNGRGETEMPHTDANRPVIADRGLPRRGAV